MSDMEGINTKCTSACGNDYDCPHREESEDRSVKLEVQHLPSDYPKKDDVYANMAHLIIDAMNDQGQKWGEERVSANDEKNED
jgi:hypothetical protein